MNRFSALSKKVPERPCETPPEISDVLDFKTDLHVSVSSSSCLRIHRSERERRECVRKRERERQREREPW